MGHSAGALVVMKRMNGIDINLTALEKQYLDFKQFAMDNAPDIILWVGSDARIHYANKEACNALGYSREELFKLAIPDIDPMLSMVLWSDYWEMLKHNK
jgi:PAS domain-containing protein